MLEIFCYRRVQAVLGVTPAAFWFVVPGLVWFDLICCLLRLVAVAAAAAGVGAGADALVVWLLLLLWFWFLVWVWFWLVGRLVGRFACSLACNCVF